MDTTAAKPASSSGGDNGASRTFQSLFGGESGRDSHAQHPKPSSERIPAMNSTNASANADDDDADVWDDDFPSDATMESAEEDNGGSSNESKRQALSSESRQSMSEWADNDDDEDQWKDALQARVDQLELVVEKKAAPPTPQLHASQMQNDHHHLPQQAVKTTTTPYAPPVDQRATLTLVPKTNLLRSISAPPAGDESKPTSKLKAPQVVRSPTATMVGNSAGIKPSTPTGGSQQRADGGVSTGDQARKRSNSRDYLTRTALAKDHKQPAKSTTPPAAAASNSVFVRAVVARGNSTAGRHAPEPRIANETTHVDKRAKADDRAAVLALSDAEAVRRYILNDVKKMSVERIIADAKRLQFLEDLHRRQPDANEAKRSASSTGGVPASAPTKKRAV